MLLVDVVVSAMASPLRCPSGLMSMGVPRVARVAEALPPTATAEVEAVELAMSPLKTVILAKASSKTIPIFGRRATTKFRHPREWINDAVVDVAGAMDSAAVAVEEALLL
jgi:hypothetical protein